MNIKQIAPRLALALAIALTLPIVSAAQGQGGGVSNWLTAAEKAARVEAKGKGAAVRATASSVTDPRDGQKYRTVAIGGYTWMAENLNYAIDGSRCYEDDTSNCKKYGRLYSWEAAKSACLGMGGKWHLPTREEWDKMVNHAGGNSAAGEILKAKSGWNDYKGKSGNGADDYGFSALPSGVYISHGKTFTGAGNSGSWWNATEWTMYNAYVRGVGYTSSGVSWTTISRNDGESVRCVEESAVKSEEAAVKSEEAKRKYEEVQARKEAAARASISSVTDPRDGQ